MLISVSKERNTLKSGYKWQILDNSFIYINKICIFDTFKVFSPKLWLKQVLFNPDSSVYILANHSSCEWNKLKILRFSNDQYHLLQISFIKQSLKFY